MIDSFSWKKPEFFKGTKIDYPNASTTKSSKKFVKGLKNLRVSHKSYQPREIKADKR